MNVTHLYCSSCHKEYAPGRKPDPSLNMDDFRAAVAAILNGATPKPPPIPAVEPAPPPGTTARATLRRPMKGDLVKELQSKLGLDADGTFGPQTEAAVRAFQRAHGFVPDGIVGPKTWAAL